VTACLPASIVIVSAVIVIDPEMFINFHSARSGVLNDTVVRRKKLLELSNLGKRHFQ
jgi:hypothetical protein